MKIRKGASHHGLSREDLLAIAANEPPTLVMPQTDKIFTEGQYVTYLGEEYMVANQRGNWVRVHNHGVEFSVHADLIRGPHEK